MSKHSNEDVVSRLQSSQKPVALITGAGRGIGRGIAMALADKGWHVVINDLPPSQAMDSEADEVAQEIQANGGDALVLLGDVTVHAQRESLVAQVLSQLGRIDLLVNNAGIAPRTRLNILDVSEQSYDEVMQTNLKAPFFLTQLVANQMIALLRQKIIDYPRIVNIGSLNAYTSSPNRGEYCLSKAGVGMLTKLFADQLAEHGINVYEIRPGIIETSMTQVVKEKYDRLIDEGVTPIRRWGQPQDIAQAVVAIAEGYLPFSTGEVINVDGGFHLQRL